ncbi:MAG: iron chelate uptake ABC transporter family permease subunit [Silicimonas sp.]|nr:iron chelate uptake ABC transporter family permease subunit [Silicimonas sp.]
MRPIAIGLAALLALSVLSLFVGVAELGAGDEAWALMTISRVPRLMAVLITGAGLAICGSILQVLVRNRFVDPMTVGTGQGAALGILLVTIFLPSAPVLVKMAVASATALAASVGFLLIAQRLPPTQPYLVALVGLIYGGIIGAGVTFVAYQADLLQFIDIWTQGEFSGVLQGRYELLWLAAGVAALSYLAADQFAILGMGRTASINLGLNYGQVMLFGLIAISVVSALTVVTVGMIPFVGLIVPNLVSRIHGDNLRRTLPLIGCSGAALVLGADILGRLLRYPFEIPVGTVLGILGAVLFLWLLYRPARHAR